MKDCPEGDIKNAIIERYIATGKTSTVATIVEDLGRSTSWVRKHMPRDKWGRPDFTDAHAIQQHDGRNRNHLVLSPTKQHLAFMLRKLRGQP